MWNSRNWGSGDSSLCGLVRVELVLSETGSEATSRLWPVARRRVPDLEEWLRRARGLTAKLAEHEARLASVTEADLRSDRLSYEWWQETVQSFVADLGVFRDQTVPEIERRLERARHVYRESIETNRAAWEEASASIANQKECPAYGGLAIEPQEGLVPIGRDPDSGLWEFAHILTGRVPDRDEAGRLVLRGDSAVVLVLLPGGEAHVGAMRAEKAPDDCPHTDHEAHDNEGPVESIRLSPFFISKFELTRGQWKTFFGSAPLGPNPPRFYEEVKNGALLHPVEELSWSDFKEALAKMNLDLPTEAQWEYAARAGSKTRFWSGDDMNALQGAGNIADRYNYENGAQAYGLRYEMTINDGHVGHAPIGSFRANRFGLHDVIGNVSEWCLDAYSRYGAPRRAGTCELTVDGPGHVRVVRGGSWYHHSWYARSAQRLTLRAGSPNYAVGVRPARRLVRTDS